MNSNGRNERPQNSLLVEAGLVLQIIAEKLEPVLLAAQERVQQAAAPSGHAAEQTHQAGCTSCPVCALLTYAKSDNGELHQHLTQGALLIVNSLLSILTPAGGAEEAGSDRAQPESTPSASPATAVQRVDIQ
ncbi:hypothetical protein EH165_06150 [Nakamurella antarctica]|uniref:Uncharacterized protein n=1 Tax=Nakamurella antarctica TaxID=1902245 RepID=A0A3G8ZKF3_9ACTN|nr:hypothetical protein [Nakamurella antarctica]AZI57792.1 hypothetical protein EH165_06150 [Nakamurella antarctica]